ncbi:MAG: DUF1566 domain-containing protein [Myxococcota bacterium]
MTRAARFTIALCLTVAIAHCGGDDASNNHQSSAGTGGIIQSPAGGRISGGTGYAGALAGGSAGQSGSSNDAGHSGSGTNTGGADLGGHAGAVDAGHSGSGPSDVGAGGTGGTGEPGVGPVQAIGVGYEHACALRSGRVYCWGVNRSGQLGDGTTSDSAVPVRVRDLENVAAISVGFFHTCALADGRIWCWGLNMSGQLGDGTQTNASRPILMDSLKFGITSVAAGAAHTCALADGVAYCWGGNAQGQLGDNTRTSGMTPKQILGFGSSVTTISAGEYQTCAVSSGDVWCWGQLPNAGFSLVPKKAEGITGVSQVSAGGDFTCALANGSAFCWGDNTYGALGTNSAESTATPVPVYGLSQETSKISAASSRACAIVSGSGYCWGYNMRAEVGDLSTEMRRAPRLVWGLDSQVSDLSTGVAGTCAIANGRAYCWGLIGHGLFPKLIGRDGDVAEAESVCRNGPSPADPGTSENVDAECSAPRTRAWARWPMPNAPCEGLPNPRNLTALSVAGGEVVVDHVTGLVWEREPTPNSVTNWQNVKARCEALTLGGYCDWRLPSRIELLSLLELRGRSWPFELTPFTNFYQGSYWTASEADMETAFSINFTHGYTSRHGRIGSSMASRCVRGGPPVPTNTSEHYRTENGTVRDLWTGLIWRAPAAPSAMPFRNAVDYCSAAGNGSRLPTVLELQTLVDESRTSPKIDEATFPSVGPDSYWSSTTYPETVSVAWYVDFDTGTSDTTSIDAPLHVLCVQ